jgi:hypothetical protein
VARVRFGKCSVTTSNVLNVSYVEGIRQSPAQPQSG